MVFSIILCFLGVLFITATLEHALNHGFEADAAGDTPAYLSRVDGTGWIKAIILGVIAGVARYAATAAGWSAIVTIIVMIAAMIYLAAWWWEDGDRFGEFVLFALLAGLFMLLASSAAAYLGECGLAKSPFWASFWVMLPRLTLLCVTGFMLVTLCQRAYASTGEEWLRILAWVLLILYILGILACVIFGVNWKALKKQETRVIPTATATPSAAAATATPAATPTATPAAKWYFYNTDCLADEEPSNDFNFGPNPLETILQRKIDSGELSLKESDWLYEVMSGVGGEKPFDARLLETATKNAGKGASKSRIAELVQQYKLRIFEIVAAEDVDRELRNRLPNDPALGAAVLAWCDAVLGTRYLGVFYDEVEGRWDAAMNAAVLRWMEYPADYNRALAAFWTFLDQAKVEVVLVSGGLNDQMYMNPYTVDHVPDIVVRETKDTEGLFLRYTFVIKEQEWELAYRIDCGYQPTNVAKLMKVTPQPAPTPTPTAKPTEPPPTATPTAKPTDPPPTATPEATPEPTGKPSGGNPDPTPTGKPSGGDPEPTPTNPPPTPTGKPSGGDPEPTPTNPPPTPTNPPPTPTNPPPTPTDPPPTPTQKPKDPTKGTDVGGNDKEDPGPGPDTNTGDGGQYSSEDLPTNTSAEDDYNDYVEWLETLRRGEEQRRGGDSNEPSTEPPKESPPPSSGGNDNPPPKESPPPSSGGNDNPPPSEPPTVQANEGIDEIPDVEPGVEVDSDLGGTGSTDDDPDGTEWDGPPD